jgi:hypothetical protein
VVLLEGHLNDESRLRQAFSCDQSVIRNSRERGGFEPRKTVAKKVSHLGSEDLALPLESTKSAAVDDAVAILLNLSSVSFARFWEPACIAALGHDVQLRRSDKSPFQRKEPRWNLRARGSSFRGWGTRVVVREGERKRVDLPMGLQGGKAYAPTACRRPLSPHGSGGSAG